MRTRAGVPRGRRAALVLVTSLTCLLTGCADDPAPPAAPSSPETVPLTDVDLAGLAAVRAPFCESLDVARVGDVLGGPARHTDSYAPGDRVRLTSEVVDVADEHGCTFTRGAVTARAWLLAQPVTRGQAREYATARRRQPECSAAGVLEFGSPGVVQTCRPPSTSEKPGGGEAGSGSLVVTMSGLFGDGWLTCQVTDRSPAEGDALLEGAQRWCAEVARTVASG